jgi:Icc-related predicted phosphoesterase
MNIATFADLHGRILLAFQLCARWQHETGESIDLILQAGDLGAFSSMDRLDRATRKYAERDPTELGFLDHFMKYDKHVAARLAETTCPLVFVRGNHEDHIWLDSLEQRHADPIFPIDVYGRVYQLKTGIPWTFLKRDEEITILGIGRVAVPPDRMEEPESKHIQPDEQIRLVHLQPQPIDILLTHDARPDFVLAEAGIKTKVTTGMPEIADALDRFVPAYHFFGHYGGPPQVRRDENGTTLSVKLADLHWEQGTGVLEQGSMGLLRWQSRDEHSYKVIEEAWLQEYMSFTWKYL